jgi:hypothetical protein
MPLFILLSVLLPLSVQVCCIVHAVGNGRSTIWITALIFLPMASAIAYFIVEILPGLRHNRHVRAARQKIVEKIDRNANFAPRVKRSTLLTQWPTESASPTR